MDILVLFCDIGDFLPLCDLLGESICEPAATADATSSLLHPHWTAITHERVTRTAETIEAAKKKSPHRNEQR